MFTNLKARSLRGLALLASICIPLVSYAQAGADVWSLERCLEHAYKNNITILNNVYNKDIASNNTKQSYYNYLPAVSANGSQSFSRGGRTIDPFTNTAVQSADVSSNNFQIGANWNLFNGFANYYNLKSNATGERAAIMDLEAAKNDIGLRVVQGYTNVLFNKEQLKAAEAQATTTKQQAERIAKQVSAGAVAEVNLLNIKAQLATEELNVLNAKNNQELSLLQLQQLLQLEASPNFQVFEPRAITLPDINSLPSSSQTVYEYAASAQPSVQAAIARELQAQYAIKQAQSSFYPTLSASVGIFTNYSNLGTRAKITQLDNPIQVPSGFTLPDGTPVVRTVTSTVESEKFPFMDQLDNNLRQGLTFSLNIPIFSNFQVRNRVTNSMIQRKQAELNTLQVKNTLRQTIEQAYLDARLSARRFLATENQVKSLKEAFRVNESRFNAGAANSLEYNTAKNNLIGAEANLVRVKYEYLLRAKVLDFYLGKPITF